MFEAAKNYLLAGRLPEQELLTGPLPFRHENVAVTYKAYQRDVLLGELGWKNIRFLERLSQTVPAEALGALTVATEVMQLVNRGNDTIMYALAGRLDEAPPTMYGREFTESWHVQIQEQLASDPIAATALEQLAQTYITRDKPLE
ncbi:MAG TPA: hypothetical protein VJR27_02570 [Candidatus Saccharimonadales bacterium]|nr:hypothetical protein [Candidatus Saccharimonadales bacterium]